jgi:ESAT-6 family protein
VVTGFDVTPAELYLARAALEEIGRDVRTEVGAVQALMDDLLGSGWQGQASAGFAQGWAQWRAGADEVLAALAAMANLLGRTGGGYESGEAGSVRAVGQSGAGL